MTDRGTREDDEKEELLFGFIIVGALFIVLALVGCATIIACRVRSREREARASAVQQRREEKIKKIEKCLVSKVWSETSRRKEEEKTQVDLEGEQESNQQQFFGSGNGSRKLQGEANDTEVGILQEQGICAICLGPYYDGDLVVQSSNTDCHHEFHLACIAEWLAKKDQCPCCRKNFLANEETPSM